jgi:hypothetical protein
VLVLAAVAAALIVLGVSAVVAMSSSRSSSAAEEPFVSSPDDVTTPTPKPVEKSVATLSIHDNDRYSVGPASAVVWDAGGPGESTAGQSTLSFQTLLVVPARPVSALDARWDSPSGTIFGDFDASAQISPTAQAGFAVVSAVITPSAGLKPASTQYFLSLWSETSTAPSSIVELVPSCNETCTVGRVWFGGSTVVVQWDEAGYTTPLVTQGFSVAGGSPLWSAADLAVQDAVGGVLVANGPVVQGVTGSLVGVDMTSGNVMWTFNPSGSFYTGYVDYLGKTLIHVESDTRDAEDSMIPTDHVLDATTGRSVVDRPDTSALAYDADSDMVVIEAQSSIEVVRASDGGTVFTLPAADFAALGKPPLVAANDGSGWVLNQDGSYELFLESSGAEDPQASSISTSHYFPMFSTGSISVIGRSIQGAVLIVAHEGQKLTVPLLVEVIPSTP